MPKSNRDDFLREACGDDQNLHDKVSQWIAADDAAGDFPVPVKAARWVRRNRTLATTGGVATALIASGLIFGSTLYGALQAKQFRIERENTTKAFELQAASEKRLLELCEAARSAKTSAEIEMRAGRFESALTVCRNSIELLKDAPEIDAERKDLIAKADRVGRLVEFFRLAEITNEQNVISRDSRAITAGRTVSYFGGRRLASARGRISVDEGSPLGRQRTGPADDGDRFAQLGGLVDDRGAGPQF